MKLGKAICQRRLALKMSQDAIADLVGMHRSYVDFVETE